MPAGARPRNRSPPRPTRPGSTRRAPARRIASRAVEGEIGGNYQLGQSLRIAGTPGWVIGKRVYQGALSYDELVKAVADARKAG